MTSHLLPIDLDSVRRLADYVKRLGDRFPGIWPRLDRLRGVFATDVTGLPAHWYLPFSAVAHALNSVLTEMDRAGLNPPRVQAAMVNNCRLPHHARCLQVRCDVVQCVGR